MKQASDQMNVKASTTKSNISKVQDTFKQYLDSSNSIREIIRENTKQAEECAVMVESITSAMQQQTNAAESLANVSQKLTETCEFISNLLKNEANHLIKIITPILKVSDSKSTINILAARLVDHANFIRSTIAEAGKGTKVTSHTECAFGKW